MRKPEQVEFRPAFQFVSFPETQIGSGSEEINTPPNLSDIIDHLDYNWHSEGLSQDWYSLGNKIGFSMKKQMDLLPNLEDRSLSLWIDRTEQDIAGFWLEYLTPDINIYPYRYLQEVKKDGSIQLTNLRYQKDITETASRQERNGSVVESLDAIKRLFTNPQTVDGSLAIMVSPMGPTGLKTDDGNPINYPDSYFFLFEKNGDLVEGFTIQTDFSKRDCREAIRRLTGIQLADNAGEDEYISATSFLIPLFNQAKIQTKLDIVNLLQDVRSNFSWNSEYAYKNISWEKVTQDIDRVNELYKLDIESDDIVSGWKKFMLEKHFMQVGDDSSEQNMRLVIQKALAATILRLSKVSLRRAFNERSTQEFQPQMLFTNSQPVSVFARDRLPDDYFTFADAQNYAQSQPGCAGGGSSSNEPGNIGPATIIESVVKRQGYENRQDGNDSENYEFATCAKCGKTAACGKCSKRCKSGCEPEWFRENGITV